MKKILTILTLCAVGKLGAQITITSAHMPSIGDTIRYSTAPNGAFDFKVSGANYAWDYSTLGISAQSLEKFQALLSTPYSTLAFTGMPIGAIGVKQADSLGSGQAGVKNIYNFYDKKSAGWSAVGTGFTLAALPVPAGGVYSDKDEIYTFPLNYNDQDSTTFYVKTPLGNQFVNLGSYEQKGYRVNKVEGWGKITTPYASNVNCIKIKSRVVENDSLSITAASINVGFPNTRVEYRWLSTTEKIPMLEVIGTELAGTFTPTTIRYRDNFRAITPSPFGPRVRFSSDKIAGKQTVDTFSLINQTTPPFGVTYTWTVAPSAGVRFVKNTTATSANPFLVFDNTGKYSVKLSATSFAGSKDSTAVDMITISSNSSGLDKVLATSNLIYPNPVKNAFYFNNALFENRICMVFDVTGKLIMKQQISADLAIHCETLPAGLYTVVIADNEVLFHEQMMKE